MTTRPRPWLVLSGYLFAIAVLVGLMESDPWLDPTSSQGGAMGTAMIVAWCLGLGVLTLGAIRHHRSRFRVRTLCLLTVAVAVYLGLWRAIHPVFPTMLVAAGLSVAMLLEAQRGGGPRPLRGQLCRGLMMIGGLLFLAHVSRVIMFLGLLRLGWSGS